jgi:hypothetical protein
VRNRPFGTPLPMLSHGESDWAEDVVQVYVLF